VNENSLISARVSPELAERLAALARLTNRSKSYLAAQAIEEFVNVEEWHVRAIKEGIAAAERGEVKAHDYALDILKTWGKNVRN